MCRCSWRTSVTRSSAPLSLLGTLVSILLLTSSSPNAREAVRAAAVSDLAAARTLGYMSGVVEKCPNLEMTPQADLRILKVSNLKAEDIAPGGRLRKVYEARRDLALRHEFDAECAAVLTMMRELLQVKSGQPAPTGPGYLRDTISTARHAR